MATALGEGAALSSRITGPQGIKCKLSPSLFKGCYCLYLVENKICREWYCPFEAKPR